MLSVNIFVTQTVVAATLVAFVLIFTDRGAFAWALAGAVYVGSFVGEVVIRAIRTRSNRTDQN